MDNILPIEIGVGIVVGAMLLIGMIAETRAYRDYMQKSQVMDAMAVGMQEFWKQSMGKLGEIAAINESLVMDATEKSRIIRSLTSQVEGLDVIVQAYGEVLNVKSLSAVKKKKGSLFGEDTNGPLS